LPSIIKRCGNDPRFASQILERFRTHAARELAKLEKALAEGDGAATARVAHSLKSMSAYVSADRASGLARQIEELGHASQLAEITSVLSNLREEIDWAISWIGQSDQVRVLKGA
jgi:HPt (histidine-containing phosphotransfer) domain-containing protein